MSGYQELIENLKNPPAEYTPYPFWFINDEPDTGKFREQLEDFVKKGVNGIIIHPRIGIPKEIEYLSEAFFAMIGDIVKIAAELKISVILYDEAMYPSGSAHGQVVAANPDFASIGIILTKDISEGKIIASYEDGYYLVQKKSHGTIRGIHFGEDDGEAGAPASADILNPEAVDKFIELTHDRYYTHLKEYFGSTIIAFFTDEPCVLGRNTGAFRDWTDGFEEVLMQAGGNPDELRALFEKKENDTTYLYHKLIKKRLMEVYYKKLSDWCQSHGILLAGHPEQSNDIDEEMLFGIPGQDLIFRRVSPEAGGIDGMDSVQAKCSADVARHMNRRRNLNECFGVCIRESTPWYITAEDMKWFIDYLGVRGVNLYVPHSFFYSIRDARKDERPPDVGPNNIWWKHYKIFSDYMKRISYIMTDSKNCAGIVIPCTSGHVPYEEVKPLFENQVEFNYIPSELLEKADIAEGKVKVADYEYTTIYIPDEHTFTPSEKMKMECKVITTEEELSQVIGKYQAHDFSLTAAGKNLRMTHLIKNDTHIYYLFNEGLEDYHGGAVLREEGIPVGFDMWKGVFFPMEHTAGTEMEVKFSIASHDTLVIIMDKTGKAAALNPMELSACAEDWTERLKLVSENKEEISKTYSYTYYAEKEGNLVFEVLGKEMAECYCDGIFIGVSFKKKHQFTLEKLTAGAHQITLVMTGNIANRYQERYIPYGIGQEAE